MKKALAITGIVVGGLIVLLIAAIVGISVLSSVLNRAASAPPRAPSARQTTVKPTTPVPQNEPAPQQPNKPAENPIDRYRNTLTAEDYESIHPGDDCAELVARFGAPASETKSETEMPGLGRMSMDMYMWRGEGLFASVTVMCQDGAVYMKTNTKF